MKIRTKLIAIAIGVIVLIAAMGTISILVTRNSLETTIGHSSTLTAKNIIKNIDKDINSKIEQVKFFSSSPLLQKAMINSNKDVGNIPNIQEYIKKREKAWSSVPKDVLTPFMKKIINNPISSGLRNNLSRQTDIHGHPVYGEIFITNKYGVNIAQTTKTTDYYQADETWWQKAKSNGLYVGKVEFDESANMYSIPICYRINDKNKNFLGIIKSVLNIEEIFHVLENAKKDSPYKTANFELLNSKGVLILGTGKYSTDKQFPSTSKRPSHIEHIRHDSYFVTKEHGKETVLIAHVHTPRFKNFKGLGWMLIAEYDTEEIFAPVSHLTNIMFYVICFVIVMSILIIITVSRSISKPMRALQKMTHKIGQSNFDIEIKPKSKDELGQLTIAFNNMAKELKLKTVSIEKLNTEIDNRQKTEKTLSQKTDELQERVKEINCLFQISKLTDKPNTPLHKIYQETVNAIPHAWRDPETTCARLLINNEEYTSLNFSKFPHNLRTDIIVNGKSAGTLTVYSKEIENIKNKTTFLKEEKNLLTIIGKHLARIIENKQAETATEIEQIFNTTSDGIGLLNLEGKVLKANKSFLQLLKLNENEIIKNHCFKTYPYRKCDIPQHLFEQVRKENKTIEVELEIERENGDLIKCTGTTAPFKNSAGDVIGVVQSLRDTTEEKKVQEKVKMISKFPSENPHPVLRVGYDKTILYANESAIKVLNKKNLKKGQPIDERWHKTMQDIINTGKTKYGLQTKEGNKFFSWTFVPIQEDKYLNMYGMEITKLQEKEKLLKEINVKLKNYTTELEEKSENLKIKTDDLQRSNEDLEQFAYVASHDLQEPLRMITSSLQIIEEHQKNKMDEKSSKFFTFAIEGSARMRNLINSLLEYSRLGSKALTFDSVDLQKAVSEIVLNLKVIISESKVKISYNQLPKIHGDKAMIVMLFQNIISNGIKYHGKNQPTIDISYKSKKETIEFCIADNGIGIPQKDFERIFVLFKRLQPRTQYSGTGIGLAMCKKIIEIHGGQIRVESKIDQGTKFYFTLNKTKD